MSLTHRLQVLIDPERYELLRRETERTGAPVGAIVRAAIDEKLGGAEEEGRRSEAARRLLAAPRPRGREPDWETVKHDLDDDRWRRTSATDSHA
ncbi:MAG: hypothetical protein ACR2ML_10470 [Solirubrobacteraceae bacterium]